MDLPLVTVFTLIYNTNPKFVIEAIESVRANNYPNLQHIIVDDCSTDKEPKETVKKWIDDNSYPCEFYEHEVNYGVCKTLNHVLELAKGEYIFGCSDDIISENKILKEVNILQNLDDSYVATYSDSYLIDQNSNQLYGLFIQKYRNFSVLPDGEIFEELLNGNFLPANAMMWKTDAIKQVGGYDESLPLEDFDLHLRLFKHNKIKLIETPLASYRIHPDGLSNKLSDWYRIYYEILSKHKDNSFAREVMQEIKVRKLKEAKNIEELKMVDIKNYRLWYIVNRIFYIANRTSNLIIKLFNLKKYKIS
jgi:GT2 family glycosyltransferase